MIILTTACLICAGLYWIFSQRKFLLRVSYASEDSGRGPSVVWQGLRWGWYDKTPHRNPNEPHLREEMLISHRTPLPDIADCLVQLGCKDITPELVFENCSTDPFSHGGFGTVHKGTLRSGRNVAIKCVEVLGSWESWVLKEKSLKHAAHEIYVWSKCDHPAVLPLLGFARLGGHVLLVSPWMENGSLVSYITQRLRCNRIRLSIELASALAYLHDVEIVHGDVKADNVVISDDGHVQLGDFGSAIPLHYSSVGFTQTGFKGTQRFMAPELLNRSSNKPTVKADIYALGMTILQIMTGKPPYADQPDFTVPNEVLVKRNAPGRPSFDGVLANQTAKDKLWHLLTRCWAYEPESRPAAMEVKEVLVELEQFSLAK